MRIPRQLAIAVVLVLLAPGGAYAYSRGVSFLGCNGCHGEGTHTMDVTMTPADPAPGETATVQILVMGDGSVAGLHADIGEGSFEVVAGGGLARTEGGVTHDGARTMSDGLATFELRRTAPASPGSVRFDISSVVGNGNGRSSGDGAVDGAFDFVYGCEPQTYYRDFDGDGHGRASHTRLHCAGGAPEGYSELSDDCNDSDGRAHPGAEDVCNGIDDDCNGEVDDGAEPVDLYADADGDGYYSRDERESGETRFGCLPVGGGWASQPGDCAPDDPAIHPGAEETCNMLDDDCDGTADERVRPQCGQGWCRRDSFTCDLEDCVPGEPQDETCNYLDDDCDGGIDEGTCPAGQACRDFECVSADSFDAGPPGRSDAGARAAPSDGGCNAGAAGTAPLLASLVLLLALLHIRRRRA